MGGVFNEADLTLELVFFLGEGDFLLLGQSTTRRHDTKAGSSSDLGRSRESQLFFVRIERLLVLLQRIDIKYIGKGARVVPPGDDLTRAERLRFQETLDGLGCCSRAHLLQVLNGVLVLNHLNELFVDLDVLNFRLLAILQGDLNAEFVEFTLLILVEPAMLKHSVLRLEFFKQTVTSSHLTYELFIS